MDQFKSFKLDICDSYPLIFALPTEEVEEVDNNTGYHQDLDVVVLPIGSLKIEKLKN